MKKVIYTLALISMICFAISCNKEDKKAAEEESLYKVSLKIGGEITTADSPLTKADGNNILFGISVYRDGSEDKNCFAYGLFDNINDISIFLLSGHSYTFKCTLIKNGKLCVSSNYNNTSYYSPFQLINLGSGTTGPLTNTFTYYKEDTYYRYHLNVTDAVDYSNDHKGKYDADRYYCEVYNYTPSVNGSVDLNLKHCVVGLKYSLSGLTDGSLAIQIKRSSDSEYIVDTSVNSDTESEGLILECNNVLSSYNYPDTYTETATVRLVWTRGNNIVQNLGRVDVELKRNMMNCIRINLSSSSGDAQFGITQEADDMTTESVDVEVK